MSNFKSLSDAELSSQINSLRDEEARRSEERRKVRVEKATQQFESITKESIDIFFPEHGRTSCSDKDRSNGLGDGDRVPRCNRCALLEILSNGAYIADGWEINVTINWEKIE
jgi:hypothetical protein